MIYLRPEGGLCNRMRTMDSIIHLCKEYKRDLTVIWVENAALNASYENLFEKPVFKEFTMKIVSCPLGFPENYMSQSLDSGAPLGFQYRAVRKIKNLLKSRSLTSNQNRLVKEISKIKPENRFLNDFFAATYDSSGQDGKMTSRELDQLFIEKTQSLLNAVVQRKHEAFFISSCYRMQPLTGSYDHFVPKKEILERVKNVQQQTKSTYGLHIRRSDHEVSKGYSTTDKFVGVIDRVLQSDTDASFFLSTDDRATKEELVSKYDGKIKTNQVSSYDRNNSVAVKDAVVDLYSLASTKKIFGSHQSSFSQTAADIGGIEEQTVL